MHGEPGDDVAGRVTGRSGSWSRCPRMIVGSTGVSSIESTIKSASESTVPQPMQLRNPA